MVIMTLSITIAFPNDHTTTNVCFKKLLKWKRKSNNKHWDYKKTVGVFIFGIILKKSWSEVVVWPFRALILVLNYVFWKLRLYLNS